MAPLTRLHVFLALVLLSLGLTVTPVQAQTVELAELTVDIWPDYDQPSILVLLTGQLPAGTTLPAIVTLPLPASATLNAVARVTADGEMMADIAYEQTPDAGSLSLTTPDPTFRVEYYVPYQADALERDYEFVWQSPTAVASFLVTVQQPASASAMSVMPAPVSVAPGANGLQYHNLPAQSLAADESFKVAIAYTMESPVLTVDLLATPAELAPLPVTTTDSSGPNWALIGGALAFLFAMLAAAWFFLVRPGTRRVTPTDASRARKPAPQRVVTERSAPALRAGSPADESAAGSLRPRFCHSCGEALQPGDRFCRFCGEKLRE